MAPYNRNNMGPWGGIYNGNRGYGGGYGPHPDFHDGHQRDGNRNYGENRKNGEATNHNTRNGFLIITVGLFLQKPSLRLLGVSKLG